MKCPCRKNEKKKQEEPSKPEAISKPKHPPPPPPITKCKVSLNNESVHDSRSKEENDIPKDKDEKVILTKGTSSTAVLGEKKQFKKVAGIAPYLQGPTLHSGANVAR